MLNYGGSLEINTTGLTFATGQSYALFVFTGGDFAGSTDFDSALLNITGSLQNLYFDAANDIWHTYAGGASGYIEWQFSEKTGILSTQTVPEPSTYILAGIGALFLIIAYRRRLA